MEVRGAQQPVAAHTHPSVDGIEERATFVTPGELRGGLEERHANRTS